MAEVATGPACYVHKDSPPSSYAVASVLEGNPGAWTQVAVGTLQRSFFILPGLVVAGIRGRKLVYGSILGSIGITAALFGFYHLRRKGVIKAWDAGAAG